MQPTVSAPFSKSRRYGKLSTVYNFCSESNCTDGAYALGGVIETVDGNFYGTTSEGGISGYGTVFNLGPGGAFTTLYSFCSQSGCTDGSYPTAAALVLGTDGNFYGTTVTGGINNCGGLTCGTVFRVTPSGTLTTIYNFCSQSVCTDGEFPEAGLVQGRDGNFYGTTAQGGDEALCFLGCGTVFKITPSGTLTTLHIFDYTDGAYPDATLVQASDGNFYGTTYWGGAYSGDNSGGTVFQITTTGTLTTLHSFCAQTGCPDGNYPDAPLVEGTDGNLYGTTPAGGANGVNGSCALTCGTIYEITLDGTLTTLHSFCSGSSCEDGSLPEGVIQGTDGTFYGATVYGGIGNIAGCATYGCGTIFSLSVGLGQFVETQPTAAPVGSAVNILGSSLEGATSVTFNGRAATFTVESSSLISTSVPAGATTGLVKVVTPQRTLKSNVPFRVIP